jgi:hypothetical protein
MNTPSRRFRYLLVPAAALLSLLALACGMQGTRVAACENEPDGDACSACCSREGYSGHVYSSMSTPPCECM